MKRLTKERSEELRQKRLDYNKSSTLDYQLGWFVAYQIIVDYLPTLSVDIEKGYNTIKVNPVDSEIYNELDTTWFDNPTTENWSELMIFRSKLKDKYLPKTLECHVTSLNISNMDEFKRGLSKHLYDSDVCYYNTEPNNIEIKDDESGYFTTITLRLDI